MGGGGRGLIEMGKIKRTEWDQTVQQDGWTKLSLKQPEGTGSTAPGEKGTGVWYGTDDENTSF